ncbi:MAG: serine protease [Acidobacteriaceae bacterium]|nr:serine protease [Acidobacteriaceae bacterium]
MERAGQTVVTVHGRPRVPSSGVLWKEGVVVTADHTLRRDEELRITLPDGQSVGATLAGRDPGTDLAVLRTEQQQTPAAQLQDIEDLKPGSLALVVGRSHETGVSAALGVISTVSGPWHTWRGGKIDQFVRLDVGLYPGASGGAVVDASGRLVGIATGGLSRTSALAIPRVTVTRVVEALLKSGRVARGYLGLGLQPVVVPEHLRTELAITQKTGLIALSVEPDAPAGKAGIVIGDVLLTLNGNAVGDTDDLQAVLGPEFVGKTVDCTILRGGARANVQITIGERPQRRC